MKKLLILTSLLISGGLWANPMDEICSFEGNAIGGVPVPFKLEEKWCERNNILEVTKIRLSEVTYLVNSYCRFDRNVYVQEIKQPKGKRILYDLGCVLYDTKARARL